MIVELGIAALAIAGGVYWVAKKQEKHEKDEQMAEDFNPSGPDYEADPATGPAGPEDSERFKKLREQESTVFDPESGPSYVPDPSTGPGVDDIRKSRRYEWLKNRETEDPSGPSGPN